MIKAWLGKAIRKLDDKIERSHKELDYKIGSLRKDLTDKMDSNLKWMVGRSLSLIYIQ